MYGLLQIFWRILEKAKFYPFMNIFVGLIIVLCNTLKFAGKDQYGGSTLIYRQSVEAEKSHDLQCYLLR